MSDLAAPDPFPRPRAPRACARRPALMLVLALAALVSFTLAGVTVQEGIHPLALLASLVPLQLGALLWGLSRLG